MNGVTVLKKVICFLLAVVTVLITFIGCKEEPAYMHPYGEGVDPDTVTTVPFQTRTTTDQTTTTTTQTKATLTTVPHGQMQVEVPEGHILCPLCQGILVICDKCYGTAKIKAEILNESSGIYVRKYIECTDCAETPGYKKCELCENKLYIPE